MNAYSIKSIKKLFSIYTDENNRINEDDAALTKRLIREELRRRTETAIKLLEQAKTEKEAEQIYKQFIEH